MSRFDLSPKIKADHHERRQGYLKIMTERKQLQDNLKHFTDPDDLVEIARRMGEIDELIDAYWAWVTENIPTP